MNLQSYFPTPRQIISFHNEAERQARIDAIKDDEATAILNALMADDALAEQVCDDIPGNMTTEVVVRLIRANIRNDMQAVKSILREELLDAVHKVAEYRAIAIVEQGEQA